MVAGMNMSIEWHNGETNEAETATEILEQLLHGWNPSTLPELKTVLAKRAVISPPNNTETDEQFLQRLHDAGVLVFNRDE